MVSFTDKGTKLNPVRLRVAGPKNSKQNKIDDADSGQPKAKKKRPKRETKNGGGTLNCFFFFILCVCHLPLPNNSSY